MSFIEFNKILHFGFPDIWKYCQFVAPIKLLPSIHTPSILLAHERHHLPGQDFTFSAWFLPQKVSNPLIKVHSKLSLPYVRSNLLRAVPWTITFYVHYHIQKLFKEINTRNIELTGLSCWIFNEKGRYVLVHSHLIFSNAGVGTSVFIANATDMKFTSICCKRDTHKQCSSLLLTAFPALSSIVTASQWWLNRVVLPHCVSLYLTRGFLMGADVLLLSISTYHAPHQKRTKE